MRPPIQRQVGPGRGVALVVPPFRRWGRGSHAAARCLAALVLVAGAARAEESADALPERGLWPAEGLPTDDLAATARDAPPDDSLRETAQRAAGEQALPGGLSDALRARAAAACVHVQAPSPVPPRGGAGAARTPLSSRSVAPGTRAGAAMLEGSGAFLSARGLVVTAYPLVATCVARWFAQQGRGPTTPDAAPTTAFVARAPSEEWPCPELTLGQCLPVGASGVASEAMPAGACAAGQRWRTYPDVRLVFAPEWALATLGGGEGAFAHPHHALDVALLRVWEGEGPAASPAFVPLAAEPVREAERVFGLGFAAAPEASPAASPASSPASAPPQDAGDAAARLRVLRDRVYPDAIARLEAARAGGLDTASASPAHRDQRVALEAQLRALRALRAALVELEAGDTLARSAAARSPGPGAPPPPDGTLRISRGEVRAIRGKGGYQPWAATLGGTFVHQRRAGLVPGPAFAALSGAEAQAPWAWLSDHEVAEGMAGSPVLNAAGAWVGVVVDVNEAQLARRFRLPAPDARAIVFDAHALRWALAAHYAADALVAELSGHTPPP